MNLTFKPSGTPVRCGNHSLAYWLEHPLVADDVKGAKAIYRSATAAYAVCMFFSMTSSVSISSRVGLNSTTSVPA